MSTFVARARRHDARLSVRALALLLAVVLLASCGSAPRAARRSSVAASSGRVLLRGLENTQAYAVGGRLYTNGITARVLDGILWVTQVAGGAQRNYCGDPVTGRSRAPLALGSQALLLSVDAGTVYYLPDASNPTAQELARAAIDPRCHSAAGGAGRRWRGLTAYLERQPPRRLRLHAGRRPRTGIEVMPQVTGSSGSLGPNQRRASWLLRRTRSSRSALWLCR